MKKYFMWMVALAVCAGAAEIASSVNQNAADRQSSASAEASTAAFRDGAYVGKLAAHRGEAPHQAIGRWAQNADQRQYATGYTQAYYENRAADQAVPGNAAKLAAFRDGLYLGKLDSENGAVRHVAVGRWAQEGDRTAFANGYNQAYADSELSRANQSKSRIVEAVR